eukprot:s3658_g7.t7
MLRESCNAHPNTILTWEGRRECAPSSHAHFPVLYGKRVAYRALNKTQPQRSFDEQPCRVHAALWRRPLARRMRLVGGACPPLMHECHSGCLDGIEEDSEEVYWNAALLKGARYGDIRCYHPHDVLMMTMGEGISAGEGASTGEKMLKRKSWLLRDVCCSQGRTGPCWSGPFTFQRCCTTNAHGPPAAWDFTQESQCWPSYTIMRTCCSLRLPQLCASVAWPRNGEEHMERCCGEEAKPASGAHEPRQPWLKGCHRRLYAEEAILQFQGQCRAPRLRPDQLGALVAYYHRSGDVLPNMVEIQEGLLSRKVDGLEMCAPSMMLARLLEVERDSISLPPIETRSALTNLSIFWERLEQGFGVHASINSKLGQGHEEVPLAAGSDWLNVTRNSIRNSFMRIASQAKELESLAVRRKKHGFKVNVVLPVCGDKDDTHLDELERVVLQDWGHCLPRCNKRSIHCSLEV